ncbi:MAG: glycosyltransferase family 4 protein [Candidatus Hodarchaeota archaeon]
MIPKFCMITGWWNWYHVKNKVSPHFFDYPVSLMIKKGFYVEILTILQPERNELKCESYNDFKILRFSNINNKKDMVLYSMYLFNYILKNNYNIIHLHNLTWPIDVIPMVTNKLNRIPMVYTSHDPYFFDSLLRVGAYTLNQKIKNKLLKIMNSKINIYIAFTNFQKKIYNKMGIKNVKVIPHGIDPTVFNVEPNDEIKEKYRMGEFNILCVGNYEHRKGQHLIVRGMNKILSEYPKTKLILVGRAFSEIQRSYYNSLISYAKKHNLINNISFLSDIPKDDLIQLYISSNIFVLPTQTEMAPLVYLEAMAAGLPTVTTNRPYIKEILGNGSAGILTKRTQKSFEDAIINLISNTKLIKNLSNNGKIIITKNHILNNVVAQLWDLYQSLM